MAATLCEYFPVGFHQDFSSLCLLVITDLRQGQTLQPLYGHWSALSPWFVVSQTALLPQLADPRIKSSPHKCQMIDSRTACIFASNFSRDAYYADLLLLISISKALFAGSCTIKTAATQDMN